MRRDALARWILAISGLLLLLSACRTPGEQPVPTPTSRPTPRPFTVMSTDQIRVTDPAAITDAASTVLALNVFQRLMTADPGGSVLKPDAAVTACSPPQPPTPAPSMTIWRSTTGIR